MTANISEQQGIAEKLGISPADLQARKEFIGFGQRDAELLLELKEVVKKNADKFVATFYENIGRYPELIRIIEQAGSNIERLKSAQRRYLLGLFDGQYEMAYVEQRLKIGIIHNEIGLTPRWYLGSYAVYLELLIPLIQKKYWFRPQKAVLAMSAVYKILSFDAQLAIDTYIYTMLQDFKSVSTSKAYIEGKVASYREFIEKVAKGNLSERIGVDGDDDLSNLGEQLNMMTDSLSGMVSQTREATHTLFTTTNEVRGAVSSQSAGAAQQAAAVAQATSSLKQIRAISDQTQEKAAVLGKTAERTRAEGEAGMIIVDQAVDGMESIRSKVEGIASNIIALSEQTQQIGEITSSVNNLAQQLKMLALNASIEASKAGEAGKGFVVVAAEVRDLAEQSQQATQQVHTILQEIQRATDKSVMVTEEGSKGVDFGMELVKKAGDAVKQLTIAIEETEVSSQQILASIKQEAIGIDQVTAAMSEINQATGHFVDNSNQTKMVAEQLNDMANDMQENIRIYQI